MPEPIRARHLIAWCAKRAVDAETGKKNRSKGKERTDDGDRIINEIMEEFITSLGRGEVDTNVFAQVVRLSMSQVLDDANAFSHPRKMLCCDLTRGMSSTKRLMPRKKRSLHGTLLYSDLMVVLTFQM